MKPDGIILGTVDAKEQAPVVKHAVELGIKVVGWHASGAPGPVKDPPVITNITTDPNRGRQGGGAVRRGGFRTAPPARS